MISRRQFLQQAGGLTFCLALAPLFGYGAAEADELTPARDKRAVQFNAYVHISPDGTVTIINPAAEMGQGVLTALPVIVAEELDVEWDDVRIESSPPFGEVYGDPFFFNRIFTTSSRSIANYYERLRRFGREARQVLLENAAQKWGVPVAELSTAPSLVMHDKTGRSAGYGEIAAFAQGAGEAAAPGKTAGETGAGAVTFPGTLDNRPMQFKARENYRLVGKYIPRRDLPEKVTGAAPYSMDARPAGLVYAAVSRAPVEGATVRAVDEHDARSISGVLDVIERPESVAVVTTSYPAAVKARDRLEVTWHEVEGMSDFDSDDALEQHRAAALDLSRPGFPWDSQGDISPLADEARGYAEQGFQAMKMKIGLGINTDLENVRAVRDAIGDEIELMVDANCAYSLAEAARLAQLLEPYNIGWFEEPLSPEDYEGYAELRTRTTIPIAGGESEYLLAGFRHLLANRCVDIAQPDICGAGGLTECKRIAALASAFQINLTPHSWGAGVAFAAGVHLVSTLDVLPGRLRMPEPLLEFDRSPNPLRDNMTTPRFAAEDGYVAVPTAPGLGVDVDMDCLSRHLA